MKTKSSLLILVAVMFSWYCMQGQNSTYRTLLPEKIVDEIIGEASGETAMQHIIEMGAYNHNRPAEEYSGNFMEADYVYSKLIEYGLSGAIINKYPGGNSWDGIRGELWETSPKRYKLADYGDLTSMLASGSTNTDVEAELVWVGTGSSDEIEKAGVDGKIVVTSGSASRVHSQAISKGAVGVVSFNSPRPLAVNLAIPISGISGRGQQGGEATFGFYLPPREGHLLRDRLLRGENIKVHAYVEAQTLSYQLQVPECVIKGTDENAGEVIFSAHLFEGYVKQGANDNISGSAAILEVARMLKTMIDEGRLERPRRSIRFIWVPEFSGTRPWVNANAELMKNTLCNINLDMVGINLADNQSFLCMQRTTYGNAHYINDVMENYYKFVGITNREGLAITGRGGYLKRIVAPSGSDDPFYFRVDDHYGASDHEVFNDPAVAVPGIMMITWPDLYYHTSQDRADKCDPTQLKRVCVIAASAAYTIASADNDDAVLLANEIVGNASSRIGKQLTRATDGLANADQESFIANYTLGVRYIQAAIINEKATLRSVNELTDGSLESYMESQTEVIEAIGKANLSSFENFMNTRLSSLGLARLVVDITDPEKEAKMIIPMKTSKILEAGYGAGRSIMNQAGDLSEKYPVTGRIDINEILRLSNGINTAYDIKILIDGQLKSGETDMQSVTNTIKILEETGYLSF